MFGHRELTLDDYLAMVRRRLWWIIVPAVVVPLATYLYSLRLPDRYMSQTLILVEVQKVPESFVRPVVTDDLNSRLATMQEQILSRTRLQPIIERFGLFKDGKSASMEDLVDQMRKSIMVTPIRSDIGRTGGLPGFYVSFMADSPRLAQQVCAEITSMFMSENLKHREQAAQGTTDFLHSQLEDSKRSLDETDQKLAEFKLRYIGQLPGDEQSNFAMLTSLNSQLDAVTQALGRAQQDKTYAESMLSQQLEAWKAAQSSNSPQAMEQQLAALQSKLLALEERYTSDFPDVVKTKNAIAMLKEKIAAANSASAKEKASSAQSQKLIMTEPQSIRQLRLTIYQLQQTIEEKSAHQERLQQQIKSYQARVQLSPTVEEQYKKLTRDYEISRKFYEELLSKSAQSEMATDLERRQEGEQFRVMDPPNLPEKPTFPDRRAFAAGGLAGGLALGFGIAFLLELRDKSLRTERDVEFYLELPTLALLPWVTDGHNGASRAHFWKRRRAKKSSEREAVGA